ncbi:MAG: MDR family MFS transporter [Chloroflexi bacterium]|nr:MDR family MFS transporter [Chloroflexota bacterium]
MDKAAGSTSSPAASAQISHAGAGAGGAGEWEAPDLPRRAVLLTLGGVMLAMFLASLDQTIVATALPRIVADLGGFSRFTWITTAYIVASTSVVPLAGSIADVYGRKWLYVAGITVFLIGSVLSALSQSMDQLIAARAVQGLGGGTMMALSFVTIGDLFPPSERGKYQGIIAGMFGISSVLGPTIGGLVTDNLSWHWIFYINLPLGIPVLLLFIRLFPEARPAKRRRIDWIGAALMVLSVVPALLAVSVGGTGNNWTEWRVITGFTISATALPVFVWWGLHVPDPILPFVIFKNRVVAVSMAAIFLTGFAMFGAITFIPLLFQGVLGDSATKSGSFLTPMMLGIVAGAAISGQVLSRTGGHYRIQGVVGLAIMSAGVGLLSAISADTSRSLALSGAITMGVGLGTTFPLFTIAVQNAVEYRFLGVATSSTQFFRSIGGSVGLAIFGAFLASRFSSYVESSTSAEVRDALDPATLEELSSSPNALVAPDSLQRVNAAFADLGERGGQLSADFLETMRVSLANAIGDIFTIALGLILMALVLTLFLKEIPLKRRGNTESKPQEPGAPAGK